MKFHVKLMPRGRQSSALLMSLAIPAQADEAKNDLLSVLENVTAGSSSHATEVLSDVAGTPIGAFAPAWAKDANRGAGRLVVELRRKSMQLIVATFGTFGGT